MQLIGKIDVALFQKISSGITTDEVILTDNRAQHVRDKRAEVYERCLTHLPEVLQSPDYILRDPKHENTALVIKRFERVSEIVLRLCTDDSGYKNSIISFWEIKESRLQRYLVTHEILHESTEHM
ncbi:MAG: PBECR2 nuclease fold domain-containing protein [Oscillospiraceae bacterium]|nr:PBECR2 nuclease fold domain-containing protein [Oscillospiraceae bacterium]